MSRPAEFGMEGEAGRGGGLESDRDVRGSAMLLVSVGNTRTRFAAASGESLMPSRVMVNSDLVGLGDALVDAATGLGENGASGGFSAVLLASVNEPVAGVLAERLSAVNLPPVRRLGRDIPIPIRHLLPAPVTVGQDRLLNALAAYERTGGACAVIDAGTAVTVDLVDAEGEFKGGAIAPGLRAQLAAMSRSTAQLPPVELPQSCDAWPSDDEAPRAFGVTTSEAMTLGVVCGLRGLVRALLERYAASVGAYPRVIATGGDAPFLFSNEPVVEHIVPDLTLLGMLACVHA
ncbi:MAG: type III pantothenate kinase [Phycisphaerae bacterium]|nr:type III pantothenate kinase [Phycisphaerae bacterium]